MKFKDLAEGVKFKFVSPAVDGTEPLSKIRIRCSRYGDDPWGWIKDNIITAAFRWQEYEVLTLQTVKKTEKKWVEKLISTLKPGCRIKRIGPANNVGRLVQVPMGRYGYHYVIFDSDTTIVDCWGHDVNVLVEEEVTVETQEWV